MAASAAATIWLVTIVSCMVSSCWAAHVSGAGNICYGSASVGGLSGGLKGAALLRQCRTLVGNLQVALMENIKQEDLAELRFPNLKEVTGWVVVYRVARVTSLGQLFPNLVRVRGQHLLHHYALVVYDLIALREVGLYNLVLIDRGGVVVWAGDDTCWARRVLWPAIAPGKISLQHEPLQCAQLFCLCPTQHCWNTRRCQRFLNQERCDPECLGCAADHPNECSLCRHYTYGHQCLPACPPETVVIEENQHCVSERECKLFGGWRYNGSCVSRCPLHMKQSTSTVYGEVICAPCLDCVEVCNSRVLVSLNAVQEAGRCDLINGSLVIHLSHLPHLEDELVTHLQRIREVRDYIHVTSTGGVRSLRFLSGLRRVRGATLLRGYSLLVENMPDLTSLLPENVTTYLQVDHGTLGARYNPRLCPQYLVNLTVRFPTPPGTLDIPTDLNGGDGECGGTVQVLQQGGRALVIFSSPPAKALLYAPSNSRPPECLSWHSAPLNVSAANGLVMLPPLLPATNYSVCVEVDGPAGATLRSEVVTFVTPPFRPPPPALLRVAAISPGRVVLRWANHRDYRDYITHHELDVSLIKIPSSDLRRRDHCHERASLPPDPMHAVVMAMPSTYSICNHSCRNPADAWPYSDLDEEAFDASDVKDLICNGKEYDPPVNASYDSYVQSLFLNVTGTKSAFEVENLAPFQTYRFRLRACIEGHCSRSARRVVTTLPDLSGDIPQIEWVTVDEDVLAVAWQKPAIVNGATLKYTVEAVPELGRGMRAFGWTACVHADKFSTSLRVSRNVREYRVRICAASLALGDACGPWLTIAVQEHGGQPTILLAGLLFALFLAAMVMGIGVAKARGSPDDVIPLVDMTAFEEREVNDATGWLNIPL